MEVQKAFDPQDLVKAAREQGGPEAEKLIKANWEAFKAWGMAGASKTENTILKMGIPVLITALDPIVSKAIDQVDGKQG